MEKRIIKNANCVLEIEGEEKINLKIKDKEILNYDFYLKTASFISKEEAKKLLEFNKNLSSNFQKIKIYPENDFIVIKFLNYEIFFSEVVIIERFKLPDTSENELPDINVNETFHITFNKNIKRIKEKNLPKLNEKFQANDFTIGFGKYWVETALNDENPAFRYEIGCEEKFTFYLNEMSYKSLASPKFQNFVRMLEIAYKYITLEAFFKEYFSIK